MVPAPDRILSGFAVQVKGLGSFFSLVDEAVDACLEIDDGSEDAALESPLSAFGKEALDGIEPEHEVGVMWKMKREWRLPHFRMLMAA